MGERCALQCETVRSPTIPREVATWPFSLRVSSPPPRDLRVSSRVSGSAPCVQGGKTAVTSNKGQYQRPAHRVITWHSVVDRRRAMDGRIASGIRKTGTGTNDRMRLPPHWELRPIRRAWPTADMCEARCALLRVRTTMATRWTDCSPSLLDFGAELWIVLLVALSLLPLKRCDSGWSAGSSSGIELLTLSAPRPRPIEHRT